MATTGIFLLNHLPFLAQSSAQRRGQTIGMLLAFMVIGGIGYIILKRKKPPK